LLSFPPEFAQHDKNVKVIFTEIKDGKRLLSEGSGCSVSLSFNVKKGTTKDAKNTNRIFET